MKSIKGFLISLLKQPKCRSEILTYYGDSYEIAKRCKELTKNPKVRITSVSVTRSSHAVHRDHGNSCTYFMAISYDTVD
jgi:hypothetical protein